MGTRTHSGTQQAIHGTAFIPDLCRTRAVAAVIAVVTLVAFLLTLAGYQTFDNLPRRFLAVWIFLLWMGLLSAAVLCTSRRALLGLSSARAVVAAFAMLVATHVLVAEAAWQVTAALDLADVFIPDGHASFLLRNFGLSAIITAVLLHYLQLRHRWARGVELEAEARIEALAARIRPHFLFNSMNTIASLTRADPEAAEAAVEDLSDLFRASLREARGGVSLAEELDLARLFQRMEERRLGSRLAVSWDTDALPEDLAKRLRVPALILQPLLENAIGHGVERVPGGGAVNIRVERHADAVELVLENPTPEGDFTDPAAAGNAMALINIRERLRLMYGDAAGLDTDREGARYRARLRLPLPEGDR